LFEFKSNSFDLSSIFDLYEIIFHKFGNNVIIHKNIKIIQDKYDQIYAGISIKNIVHFNNIEKKIIEIHKDIIIKIGVFLLLSVELQAKITGNIGKTQGAKIVNTQAKKDINIKLITFSIKK
jgi:hypothetical protein